jgi:hypothetical protein
MEPRAFGIRQHCSRRIYAGLGKTLEVVLAHRLQLGGEAVRGLAEKLTHTCHRQGLQSARIAQLEAGFE